MNTHETSGECIDALLRKAAKSKPSASTASTASPADGADTAMAARIAAQVQAARRHERDRGRFASAHRRRPLSGFAAAASLLLAVFIGGLGQQQVVLPDYSLEISGHDQTVRSAGSASEPSPSLKASTGNRLRITARPAQRIDGQIKAQLWRSSTSGPVLVDLPVQISSSGAVQIDALLGKNLLLEPGAQRLWLVLGTQAGAATAAESLQSIEVAGHHGRSYVLPIRLDIQPR